MNTTDLCSGCGLAFPADGHPTLCEPCLRQTIAARVRDGQVHDELIEAVNVRRVKAGWPALCREHLAQRIERP